MKNLNERSPEEVGPRRQWCQRSQNRSVCVDDRQEDSEKIAFIGEGIQAGE